MWHNISCNDSRHTSNAEVQKKEKEFHHKGTFKDSLKVLSMQEWWTHMVQIRTESVLGMLMEKDRSQALEQSKQQLKKKDINFSLQFAAMY